jgi:tRNA threonylcarbamoyl adenosine modification protein YjeE
LGTESKEVIKDRVAAVRDFATKNNVILVLKGERVLVGSPDGRVIVNPTGNSGLGKAGNGDTLTGILVGFVAQAVQMKIDMVETVVAACYVAGMAGDVAERKYGKRVMTASDVRECLVDVFESFGGKLKSNSPDETFAFGEQFAAGLRAGDVVLLYGGLGAGKTLLTKGILSGLGFDVDEVTSPSFALVNLYKTDRFDVYHIDLWRVEGANAAEAVGLDEIVEQGDSVVIVEWAERLADQPFTGRSAKIMIAGDGDEPREITIQGPDS